VKLAADSPVLIAIDWSYPVSVDSIGLAVRLSVC
jgi:hypothetical protein